MKKVYIKPIALEKHPRLETFMSAVLSDPKVHSGAGQSLESSITGGSNAPGVNNGGMDDDDEAGANFRGGFDGAWESLW